MNLENIRKVRDAIAKLEKEPKRFNMSCWVDFINDRTTGIYLDSGDIEEEYNYILNNIKEGDCNTCACIGGWAVAVLGDNSINMQHGFMEYGAQLLGLTDMEAAKLFTPWDVENNPPLAGEPFKAGPKEAVKVLTHMLETNEIDWNAAWR